MENRPPHYAPAQEKIADLKRDLSAFMAQLIQQTKVKHHTNLKKENSIYDLQN